jgi:hypothetical protein
MSGIEIHNYDSGREPEPGAGMSLAEAQALYDFIGFAAPFVTVVRRSDGAKGTLEFKHAPRVYFGFQAD